MLVDSKVLLAIAGVLLVVDATMIVAGIPNPLGYTLPCPITLFLLGLGTTLFVFSSKAFTKA
jgi:hypothetical protein